MPNQQEDDEQKRAKEQERKKREVERLFREQADRQKKEAEERREAERKAREEAERKRREEEERRKAAERARKEAEQAAKEQAELKRKQEEEKRRAEEQARKEAEKRARELEEQKRLAEEKAKREADRLAREEAEKKKRLEEEKRRSEEQARREAERKKLEEEDARRRQEEARKQAERIAKQEAERKRLEEESRLREQQRLAREEAERQRRKELETKNALEQKVREEMERRKKEEAQKLMLEEQTRREAERRAREEAERKRKEEEQRRREEENARKIAEIQAREAAERALKEAERVAKEQEARRRLEEETKRRQEEQARREAERKERGEVERKRKEEEERRKAEEQARKAAERQAREAADLKRRQDEQAAVAAENARRDAEKLAREQENRRKIEEQVKRRQEEQLRTETERKARELEEQKRLEAETQRREQERIVREQAERSRGEAEAKRRQEDLVRAEAERKAREMEEQVRREGEFKRREGDKLASEMAEKARKEAEARARVEETARKEAERRKAEELAREEAQRPKEEPGKVQKPPGKAPQAPGPALPPRATAAVIAPTQQGGIQAKPAVERVLTTEEEQAREDQEIAERFRFLKNVKVRFPFSGTALPTSWKVLERYPVNSPFAYCVIAQSPLLAKRYFIDEIPLSKTEAAIYSYLLDALEAELTVPREQVNPRQYFADQARKILLKYSIRVPAASWSKIIYFAERDLVGFGVLDGIMRDPNIEDISIDALGKPIFVYHKGYESLETNFTISDEEQMDNLITRLSHMAGKHVSTAFPIVQGTLPGRHRLVATFRREVSPQGSSATIRKFREDPLTIIDMLNLNVLDYKMAAYVWYLMQYRATAIVVGATGAGKTTLLNALVTLTRLNTKLVTIEEVQEINIPHLNWTSLVSRESYAATEEKAGEVGLFDLVKAAMRMRPDILCVGEVRGEEAYVLFQAISTGHGGLCTLHADDSASAMQRLVSVPMNVPKAFIPFLDLVFVIRRIAIPLPGGGFRAVRRIVTVDEVKSDQEFSRAFRWDSRTDTFKASYSESPKLERISRDNGIPIDEIMNEIDRRALILRWIQQKGIRNFKEVSPILELYVSRPEEVFKTASTELEAKGVAVAELMREGESGGRRP